LIKEEFKARYPKEKKERKERVVKGNLGNRRSKATNANRIKTLSSLGQCQKEVISKKSVMAKITLSIVPFSGKMITRAL
jgi:hypothetical protein